MRRITSITAVATILLAVALIAQAAEKKSAAIGQAAPTFSLSDQSGKTVNLSDSSGKITVLEWWNEGCPIVQRHYQNGDMNKLASKWTGKGVVWLAVNSTNGSNNDSNKKAGDAWKMDRPILNDATGEVGHEYGATNTPHMFIIDTTGKLVYAGAIDNDPQGDKSSKTNYVDKALTELTGGQSVSEPQTKAYGCGVHYAK